MITIFIDESGDLGFSAKSSKFFIISLLITKNPILISPELIVGTPIVLKVYYTALDDSSSEEVSQYSGKYLITHTKQIYDGDNGSYLSVLVIDRKGTKLTGNYLRKDVLTDV